MVGNIMGGLQAIGHDAFWHLIVMLIASDSDIGIFPIPLSGSSKYSTLLNNRCSKRGDEGVFSPANG